MRYPIDPQQFEIMFKTINRIYEDLQLYLPLIALILLAAIVIADNRNIAKLFKRQPKHIYGLISCMNKENVFRLVLKTVLQAGYRVEEIDEVNYKVIVSKACLSDDLAYAIYISSDADNATLIKMGARDKLYGLNRTCRKQFDTIRAALIAEGDHPIVEEAHAV